MSYDATLLYKAAERVITDGEGYYNVRTNINIRANKKWMKPVRFDYLHLARDYSTGALGDIRQIECLILLGDYTYDLLPYRDDMLIDITEIPLVEGMSARNWGRRAGTKRYKAILDLKGGDNTTLTNKSAAMSTKAQMNQMGMKSVVFTLVDEPCYKLMMTSIGTTLRQMTTLDMILWLHNYYFKKLFDGDSVRIEGENVWRQDFNPDIQHQIAFPDGMMLKDVPRFLQNDEVGVYPTGLGRYIQNGQLFVYPLFDTTRYKKNNRVLNIINMPNERFQGTEKTFLVTDQSVTIIATGKNKVVDRSTGARIQDGNGARFGNANTILTQGQVKDNRLLLDRATNVYEVAGDALAGGVNNMRWADERYSANPYKQYTLMAQQQGQPLDVQWFRSNVDLLDPGMPVRYQTLDGETVKTYYGTLLGVNDNRIPVDPGNNTSKYDGIATLSLFLVRHTETDTPPAT
jgi:hypothetical protein